ncbi:MAG: SpoIID/LytB domain-containing protein [Paludibacteraceae bacterium]
MQEPELTIGIIFETGIEFELQTNFICNGDYISGAQYVEFENNQIRWKNQLFDELVFTPVNKDADFFEVKEVTIGINFHWERKENQLFKGALKIIVENEKLTAINIVSVEDYLTSVISSEMSATASLELLKAHAVISRSWVLKPILKNLAPTSRIESGTNSEGKVREITPDNEDLVWYERDAHTNFDVCADDHCQRYQGITRASTEIVKQSIRETNGQLLIYDGNICDARFSKCCGGVFEEFQYVWANIQYPYLKKQRDYKLDTSLPNLQDEKNAEKWIRTSPPAFCNSTDKKVLSQVLNNYDQETADFYRWKVEYTQDELAALILKRSGVDYGKIIDLVPVERGTSGRLVKLKIVGTKRTKIIGKELEIRRTLSESHLYSSAFVVDKVMTDNEIPHKFILTGAGWGHGVGLCQIGAAVMGEEGYSYNEILLHYFVGAKIEKWY